MPHPTEDYGPLTQSKMMPICSMSISIFVHLKWHSDVTQILIGILLFLSPTGGFLYSNSDGTRHRLRSSFMPLRNVNY